MTPKKRRSHPEVVVLVLAMTVVALGVLEWQFSLSRSLLSLFPHEEPRRRPEPVVSTDFGNGSQGKSLFNQSSEQSAEPNSGLTEQSGNSGETGAFGVDSTFRSQVNPANLSPLGTNLSPAGANLSPSTGSQMPVAIGQAPMQSNQMPMQSGATPVQRNEMPMQPGATPMQSNQMPMQPGATPVQSNEMPMQTGQSPTQSNQMPGDGAGLTEVDTSPPAASGRVSVAITVHPPQAEHIQSAPPARTSGKGAGVGAGESEKPGSGEAPQAIALLVPHGSHGGVPVPGQTVSPASTAAVQSVQLPTLGSLPVGLAGSRYVRDLAANGVSIAAVCPHDDLVQAVILQKYGSIFAADRAVKLPTHALFEKPSEARAFQKSLQLKRIYAEGYPVVLQRAALESFTAAEKEASAAHLKITPVGDIASLRSYEVTAMIWQRYLEKGLQFWVARHKLTAAQARAVLASPPRKQLEAVLAIEKKGLFLHANHTISILNLAAPPGSSQHISGLALDIEEHKSLRVRQIMNKHGWYQTVIRDFPHFLYLGRPPAELGRFGLTQIVNDGHQFWVPDIAVQ